MVFAIKAALNDPSAALLVFDAHKTMYGGKAIAAGDTIYLFASENEGGRGLVARGVVVAAEPTPRRPGLARQTPRVSITVRPTAFAKQPLGRADLRPFAQWNDGQAQSELNFKFYRQATDKIVGISDAAAAFLEARF